MFTPVVIVSTCVGIAALVMLVSKVKRKKFPPGPIGIPYLGKALGFRAKEAHTIFTHWNKEHGDITMVTLFGKNVVLLSHPDVIRKAFVSPELAPFMNDRPPNFLGYYVANSYKDILFREYDDICRKLKSITIRAAHASGEGSDVYKEYLLEEINIYIGNISSYGGRNVNIVKPLELSVCKLASLLFTGKIPANDDVLLDNIRAFDYYGNQMIQPDIQMVFKLIPFIRHLPGKYGNLYEQTMKEKENLRQSLIVDMKKSFQNKKLDCLTHALFEVQQKETWLSDDYILGILMDLINTSTLTSRGVLGGIFLLLVHFQDVQDKIRQEIDRIVGNERQPLPDDRHKMPYTHACILETLRYQSHLSMTATHCNASCDVTLDDFIIPKGSAIFGNLWSVHHDERFWADPWEFRPERFLQADGSLLPADHDSRRRYYMPFGDGARECLGIQSTYNRMFLYVTLMLQKYELQPPSGQTLPSHDPRELTPGTVLQPPEFCCRVVPRCDV